jgi:ABC-2 type transport system ATP-binding protein
VVKLPVQSPSGSNVIELHDVTRRYGSFEAVRGVSFTVAQGELFALLGTNGAGKTSTVEVVEGLSRPSGGQVRVLGHDPYAERAAVRPRIGIMLQEAGFAGDLTVLETLRMWAGTASRPRPVAEVMAAVELEHKATTAVEQLSGGERRRLDLALALIASPEVLFLDEPTTGLDPESRRNTWQLIRGLLAEGTTVLLTTHYLEEAEELADRLAIMHAGRIVASGTVAEVVAAHPARITFQLPAGVALEALPTLPGARSVHCDRTSGAVEIRTDALQESLAALLAWANRAGLVLPRLQARSASLEEAFLSVADGDVSLAGPRLEKVSA